MSALSTFAVGSSIGTEMKPLGGVCPSERFQRAGNLLRRGVESAVGFRPGKANGPVRGDLVSAMACAAGEDRNDGRSSEHGETQWPLGHVRGLAEECDSARSNTRGNTIDLQRNGAPLSQAPHEGKPGKRFRTDVRHVNPVPLSDLVLNGAGLRIGLGPLGHEDAQSATASDQRSDDLPTGGMGRHEQQASLVRERIVDMGLPGYDDLWGLPPL